MIEATRESVSESHIDTRLDEMAADGWRLVSVVVHPYKTEEAAPLWVCFWEKESV